jgi:DNA-binding transcriptional LysR family regulator
MTLEAPDGSEAVKFRIVMESTNDTVLHLGALEGMGVAFLPRWAAHRDLIEGRLEVVLPAAPIFRGTLYAVYPSRKYLSAKVRTFIDFLAHQMSHRDETEDQRTAGRDRRAS